MKNKIHDFGQLGKWSEDTLKANKTEGGYTFRKSVVAIIEEKYTMEKLDLNNKMEELENEKIPIQGIFNRYIQLKIIRNHNNEYGGYGPYENIVERMHEIIDATKKLKNNYQKYEKIMEKLYNKKKVKK